MQMSDNKGQYASNAISAGAQLQTPLEEITALFMQTLLLDLRGLHQCRQFYACVSLVSNEFQLKLSKTGMARM